MKLNLFFPEEIASCKMGNISTYRPSFFYTRTLDKKLTDQDTLQRVFDILVDIRDKGERKKYKHIETIAFGRLTPLRGIILAYLQPSIGEEECFLYIYNRTPWTLQEAHTYVQAQSFPMHFTAFTCLEHDMEMLRYLLWKRPNIVSYFKYNSYAMRDDIASHYKEKTCELLCDKLQLLMGELVCNGICAHTFVFSPENTHLYMYRTFIRETENQRQFGEYYYAYGKGRMKYGVMGEHYTIRLVW